MSRLPDRSIRPTTRTPLQAARSLWLASDRADRALYAAKKGGRNRSGADLAEAAEAAGWIQG